MRGAVKLGHAGGAGSATMGRMTLRLAFFLSFLSTAVVSSSDWPQWRGPARTGQVPEVEAVTKLPDEAKSTWHIPVGEGFASPVVAGGKVFYLDNKDAKEFGHALDAATGKELWQAEIGSSHKDGFGIGPRTTPLADGDRVYFQSAKGELHCHAAADGKLIWRTNFVDDLGAVYFGEKGSAAGASRHGATGSPLIDGGNLIAQVGSESGASIVAFNKLDGKVVWKSQNDQTAYAAPIIATVCGVKQFISFTVDGLIGLDPADGKLLWRQPMTTRLGRHVTTPVVVNDIVIVASHQLGTVGTQISREGTGFSAKEAWVNKKILTNFSSPVVVGNHLYGLGSNKDFICIDTKTGEPTWNQTGFINTSADQAEAAFLIMGKNIAALTDSGEFILYAADPKAFQEIGRLQVCGKTWCNPAYADGSLFLRDNKELRRVELK